MTYTQKSYVTCDILILSQHALNMEV